jgi:hypothetical protein
MSKDDFYQKTRRECASLLRYEDPDNLSGEQATRLDCVIALRLVVDDMQSKLLRGETVDVSKLLAATQELSRLLPEPQERVITGESAREKLLQTVLAVIAAEDAEASARASEMETIASEMDSDPQVLRRLEAAERVITPNDVIERSEFYVGGVPRQPDDPPPRSTAVIDAKPNPPAAPAAPAYDYNRNQDWKGFINSDGSIRSTPRGRWSI